MTAEEIRNAMNESMKKIVNTENIINFHMDLIQKAFLEALSLGMKIGEANAKGKNVKYKEMCEDMKADMCGTDNEVLCDYLSRLLRKYGEIV